ncbi:hypothetical protein [Mesorhizobium ciceri]|uniref:hypothetical protein n=1 Tax=Mesorhizobium TaxID=68287 RepID=UPI001FD995C0|nr:hypothetical protein [Mesorhizobium ciceri]
MGVSTSPLEVRLRNVATRLTSGYLLGPLSGPSGVSKDPAWWEWNFLPISGLSDLSVGHDVEKLMRNLVLAFAALALPACQSAPEPPQSAAIEPATIPSQSALDPAVVPPGPAIMDQSVTITPPSKGVPTKYAAFSGNWAGRLEGTYEGKLSVQSVSSNGKVTVTYAWGILSDDNPGEAAGEGKIVGTMLKLRRLPNGADVSFMMMPDGTLTATHTLAGQTYTGMFIRQ